MLSKKINRKKGVGEGVCHRHCSCCIAAAGAVAAASATATPTSAIVCPSSVLSICARPRLSVCPVLSMCAHTSHCAFAPVFVLAHMQCTIPLCMRAPLPLFVHPHAHLHSSVHTLLLVPAWLWVHPPPCTYAVALVPTTWSCARPPLPLFVHPHPCLCSSVLTLPLVPTQLCLHPSLRICTCLPSPPFARTCTHLHSSVLSCAGPHYLV